MYLLIGYVDIYDFEIVENTKLYYVSLDLEKFLNKLGTFDLNSVNVLNLSDNHIGEDIDITLSNYGRGHDLINGLTFYSQYRSVEELEKFKNSRKAS